jgi:hypothetical protein
MMTMEVSSCNYNMIERKKVKEIVSIQTLPETGRTVTMLDVLGQIHRFEMDGSEARYLLIDWKETE